jgi:endonuclease/exonuclease/phosphatase family metal-dependent hydrolase
MRSRSFAAFAVRTSLALAALFAGTGAVSAATTPIKVMTYNTHHGGTATSPATTQFQIDTIAAENPDVVVLQEAYYNQLSTYVNGLNSRLNTTAWHGSYNRTCSKGVEPTCTSYTSESVMILTRLRTVAETKRIIWAKDDYHVARATLRMVVELADGTQVNVFVCHLPALSSGAASRAIYVDTFKTWASSFSGPKLVGGDFNDSPSSTPIKSMLQLYADAWKLGGAGYGYTHGKTGAVSATSRIDYWFSELAAPVSLTSVALAGTLNDSDHLAVVATYNVESAAVQPAAPAPAAPADPVVVSGVTETTLFADSFTAFDSTMWPTRVITGTQDSTIRLAVSNGRLRIGDLKSATTGTHYYGVSTAGFNLAANGCASVQLAQSTNLSTMAYSMFAVVKDTKNLYRWYQAGNDLVIEKKVGDVKTTLATLQYTVADHQYLRIRKAANAATGTTDVVFETAVDNAGVPGVWTERVRDVWDAAIGTTALKVELKAGTSAAEVMPGSVYWDNVRVATNCK